MKANVYNFLKKFNSLRRKSLNGISLSESIISNSSICIAIEIQTMGKYGLIDMGIKQA